MRPNLRVVRDDRPTITQADVRKLRDLQQRAAAAAYEAGSFERALINRLDDGEQVEPGLLCATIVRREERVVTEDDIRRLMGLEVLEEARCHVAPTVTRSLQVIAPRAVRPA